MVELIWDGKYENGKRVAPVRVTLPFQTVETVNESAQLRQRAFDLFSSGRDAEWRNRLIWGDKKYVLPSLLTEFAGRVDLIYIDPPFATGANFSFQARVGDEEFTKEPNMIETKAYRDTWGGGVNSYIRWFYETAVLLHELLSAKGSLYLHIDPNVSHFLKIVLDEVFGSDNYRSEITWKRTTTHSDAKVWSPINDTILYYTKSSDFSWQQQYGTHDDSYLAEKYANDDDDGRGPYTFGDITSPNPRANLTYTWKGFPSPAKGWRYSKETMAKLDAEGRIWYPDTVEKRPRLKRYLNELPGRIIDNVWLDMFPVNSQAQERLGYPTQKPEALLERIIRASSNEGDLVLDCFCGSGTTAAVAERLGRRWITCDLGRFAIHTARKRLLAIENVKPFVVQNLGKYERQVWQRAEFGEQAEAIVWTYRRFLLDLYHAEPLEGYSWLHGKKAGRLVHVGTVDTPITLADVQQMAIEFRKLVGSGASAPTKAGIDVLGWDFALDLNESARQIAQTAGLSVRFVRIPREVLEKKAVEQGDIAFFELAALSVEATVRRRGVKLTLTDFMVPPDDVPEAVIKAVKKWSEWIDYWAVDWNFRDDTFHNEWQAYRTRKDRTLPLTVTHDYDQPGTYSVVVKVIDILGNDTTKALTVTIPG